MCIFFLALQPSSPFVLVAANNRDEFFDRKTTKTTFWNDHPNILAGRDTERGSDGGTWLGISTDGKLATVTNIRAHYRERRKATVHSRGHLVSDFLQSSYEKSPLEYCQSVITQAKLYSGFNLITIKLSPTVEAAYCSNTDPCVVQSLQPGIYGLSNESLESPWKKVTRGKERFTSLVTDLQNGTLAQSECEQQLLQLLCDDTNLYPDVNVPTLGYPESILKHLNSVFVSPIEFHDAAFYGTRTNSIVTVSARGEVTYTERTREVPVDLTQPHWETNRYTFNIHQHQS